MRALVAFALTVASLAFSTGCAVQTDAAAEEPVVESTEDAIATSALFGVWKSSGGPIREIEFTTDPAQTLGGFLKGRSFTAAVDNGVRCVTTPCPSTDEVGGVYKVLKGTKLTLASYDKPTATFGKYLGDYRIKLVGNLLTLTKTDGTVVAQLKKSK